MVPAQALDNLSLLNHITSMNFPREFQKVLIASQLDNSGLAKAMTRRGFRISKQFIGMIASGKRNCPPRQLKRICETLLLDEFSRKQLHRAAAIDYGYDI